MKHYLIDIADMPEANLLPYFQPATMFIKTALSNGGKVFVHCQAGVSRSASVSHAAAAAAVAVAGAGAGAGAAAAAAAAAAVMVRSFWALLICCTLARRGTAIAGSSGILDGNREDQCAVCVGLCEESLPICKPK